MTVGTLRNAPLWDRLAMLGLLASAIAMPITRSITLPIVGPRLTMFEVVALPTIASWVLARAASASWRTVPIVRGFDLPLALFLGLGTVSGLTVLRTLGPPAMVTFVTEWFIFVYLALLFVAARDILVRYAFVPSLLQAWAVAAIVVGVVGLFGIGEMLQCVPPMSSLVYGRGRLLATFRNPNQLAAYMVPTTMLLAGVCASATTGRLRWLAIGGGVLSTLVLFFSASRGGGVAVIGGAVLLALLMPTSSRVRWTVLCGVGLFTGLALAALQVSNAGNSCFAYIGGTLPTMTTRLGASLSGARQLAQLQPRSSDALDGAPAARSRGSRGGTRSSGNVRRRGTDSPPRDTAVPVGVTAVYIPALDVTIPLAGDTATSMAFRAVMAEIAWKLALQHPLTGVGIGTMHLQVWELSGHKADLDAHNMAMTVLAETGFIGLALFAWCIAWTAWQAFRAFRAQRDGLRAFRAGLLVALLAFLLMTITFDGQRQRVFWLLLAVMHAEVLTGSAARRDAR